MSFSSLLVSNAPQRTASCAVLKDPITLLLYCNKNRILERERVVSSRGRKAQQSKTNNNVHGRVPIREIIFSSQYSSQAQNDDRIPYCIQLPDLMPTFRSAKHCNCAPEHDIGPTYPIVHLPFVEPSVMHKADRRWEQRCKSEWSHNGRVVLNVSLPRLISKFADSA